MIICFIIIYHYFRKGRGTMSNEEIKRSDLYLQELITLATLQFDNGVLNEEIIEKEKERGVV